ncbi:Atp-Dependent Rna Helicase Dhx29 [Manis pentadactyla]|nr:Atp-Dependent Rna Helicase Dhx29 [Manis pentadactyla]
MTLEVKKEKDITDIPSDKFPQKELNKMFSSSFESKIRVFNESNDAGLPANGNKSPIRVFNEPNDAGLPVNGNKSPIS